MLDSATDSDFVVVTTGRGVCYHKPAQRYSEFLKKYRLATGCGMDESWQGMYKIEKGKLPLSTDYRPCKRCYGKRK